MDEMFEFLSGKQLHTKDMFPLGRLKKSQSSSSPPRPLFIKLCTAWDRKLNLLRKSKLRDFHIKRLFLREDVAPNHKLRQWPLASSYDKPTLSSALANAADPLLTGSAAALPTRAASLLNTGNISGYQSSPQGNSRSRSSRSASPHAKSHSVSPSSASVPSLSSSSSTTVIQGSEDNHDDAT